MEIWGVIGCVVGLLFSHFLCFAMGMIFGWTCYEDKDETR